MRLLLLSDSDKGWPESPDGDYDLSVLVRRHRPDALISLGDFSWPQAAAMARAGAPLAAGVYGNHCTRDYMPDHGIVDLVGDRRLPARHGALQVPGHRPISMLAVQGCVRYKPDREDVLFTQKQYAAAIDASAAGRSGDHALPAGRYQRRRGSRAFRHPRTAQVDRSASASVASARAHVQQPGPVGSRRDRRAVRVRVCSRRPGHLSGRNAFVAGN